MCNKKDSIMPNSYSISKKEAKDIICARMDANDLDSIVYVKVPHPH
jgi:hypothetical protein